MMSAADFGILFERRAYEITSHLLSNSANTSAAVYLS